MTALLTLLGLAGSITLLVIGGLLVAEARGQTIHRARGIARRAAHSLPPEHRVRYAEEWEAVIADLAERPLSALGQAISLQIGARRLARELVAAPALSGNQTGADQSLPTPQTDRQGPLIRVAAYFTRRAASLAKVTQFTRSLMTPAERSENSFARFLLSLKYTRWIVLGASLVVALASTISAVLVALSQ